MLLVLWEADLQGGRENQDIVSKGRLSGALGWDLLDGPSLRCSPEQPSRRGDSGSRSGDKCGSESWLHLQQLCDRQGTSLCLSSFTCKIGPLGVCTPSCSDSEIIQAGSSAWSLIQLDFAGYVSCRTQPGAAPGV